MHILVRVCMLCVDTYALHVCFERIFERITHTGTPLTGNVPVRYRCNGKVCSHCVTRIDAHLLTGLRLL